MAVRLRPQSAAWMAPHALAAQLAAQTGQIAGQGVAGLLGGIAQGVGAFTQKREQRRVEAKEDARYQDSLGMRQQEMALRKQAADREDAEGRYAILSQAAKGAENKVMLWQLTNPGQPPPPEMVMESEQLRSSLKAITTRFSQGVPTTQDVAQRQAPASGMAVNGKATSQMSDAELDDVMAKSQAGQVDVSYTGGATRDMGQGVGEKPAAAAAPEAAPAAVDGLSSGDPMADRFMDAISRTMKQIEVMEARADAIDSVAGRKGIESSKLRSQIAEAKTQLLALQGRYQVYSQDRTRKMVEAARVEDDARTQAADRAKNEAAVAEFQKYADDNKLTANDGSPLKFPPNIPAQTAAQIIRDRDITDPNRDASFKQRMELSDQRFAQSKDRIAFASQLKADAAAEARAAGVPEDKVNAIYKEIEVLSDEEDNLRAAAKDMAANGMMAQSKLSIDRADTVRTRIQGKLKEMKDWRDSIGAAAKPAAAGASVAPTTDPAAAERLKRVFGR